MTKSQPDTLAIIAAASILIGAIQCFLGYRLLKIILGLTGFFIGGVAAAAIAGDMTKETVVILIAGLVGGVVGAILMVAAYFVGVFVVGACLGYVGGAAAMGALGLHFDPLFLIVPAVLGGVLALVFQKFMVVVSTAFGGSWGVVAGLGYFLNSAIDPRDPVGTFRLDGGLRTALVVSWVVLGVLGIFSQLKSTGEAKPSNDS